MGITIKKIAEMAGVHRSTVDKVLHGRQGVSEPVRKRIQDLLDEYNYQVNPIGKALTMQGRELRVKVILLKVDACPYIQKGIEERLKSYAPFQIKIEYIVVPYTEERMQAEALRYCMEDQIDGIIISPINIPAIKEKIDECVNAGIPVITVNTDVEGSRRLCFIGQDGFQAGRVAGRLMGEFLQGIGKVALFTSDGDKHQSFPFGTREEGFRDVVSKKYPGLQVLPSIYTKEDPRIIRREIHRLFQETARIQGVFITCGGVETVGGILQEYGCSGMKLICYENYPEIMKLMKKDVVTATINSDVMEQGEKALETLLDFLIYEREPEKGQIYSESKILLKESMGL